jgi:hypothetical protein
MFYEIYRWLHHRPGSGDARLPVKIEPTSIIVDDNDVFCMVSLWKASPIQCLLPRPCCSEGKPIQGVSDWTMAMLVIGHPPGASFWRSLWSKGQKVECRGIYRDDDTKSFDGMVTTFIKLVGVAIDVEQSGFELIILNLC